MDYSKNNLWKWILLYVFIGAIAYGAVYYFFFYNKGGYTGNYQTPTTNSQTQVQNTSETAGWKTYTNTEYGFEIKYNPSYITLVPPSGTQTTLGFNIAIGNYSTSEPKVPSSYYQITVARNIASLNDLKNTRLNSGPSIYSSFTSSNTTLKGHDAISMQYYSNAGSGHYVHEIGIINNNTAYLISLWSMDKNQDEAEFNQMLSTFQFIGSADAITLNQLSDTTIINAINKLYKLQFTKNTQGSYESSSTLGGSDYINSITRGDINGDGMQDAFVYWTHCGASCGSSFTIVINKNDSSASALDVIPEGIVISGASQSSINKVIINSGTITINADIYQMGGTASNLDLTYKLVGSNLVKF
jgi:hypothetical protein